MDFAHRLVSLAYQSLGYFVIESVTAGHSEADLLAVKIDEAGCLTERIHVEVQVSVNPVGVLRGHSGLGNTASNPRQSAQDYINKKYLAEKLVQVITQRFECGNYRKVFVHGRVNDKMQLDVFRENNIECIAIGNLVRLALKAKPVSELKRQVLTAQLLSITEP